MLLLPPAAAAAGAAAATLRCAALATSDRQQRGSATPPFFLLEVPAPVCLCCRNPPPAGADALSRYIDWRDRATCILFGDGCGAVVLTARDGGECGLLGLDMHSGQAGSRVLLR